MNADPETLAQDAVEEALQKTRRRAETCAALVRLAGQALARTTNHDQAARLHAQLARRHALRAAGVHGSME
ncbi:MAG TPA: hypothetical protein VFE13_16605 [Caulobacteraceae bacterium]|jgi:uncharacterized protein YggE|nr:hypothetical protein [Caulobacteraceae bacterium]